MWFQKKEKITERRAERSTVNSIQTRYFVIKVVHHRDVVLNKRSSLKTILKRFIHVNDNTHPVSLCMIPSGLKCNVPIISGRLCNHCLRSTLFDIIDSKTITIFKSDIDGSQIVSVDDLSKLGKINI